MAEARPDTIPSTESARLPPDCQALPDDTWLDRSHIMKQRMGRWPMMVELDWSPTHYSLKNGKEASL